MEYWGIRCRAAAGPGLVEPAELDPPAAIVVPDVLQVGEESVEPTAIGYATGVQAPTSTAPETAGR
jgi:hypothetical protein